MGVAVAVRRLVRRERQKVVGAGSRGAVCGYQAVVYRGVVQGWGVAWRTEVASERVMNLLSGRLFSKNPVARVLNGLLFLSGCFLAGSGWLLAERLPHGRGTGGGRVTLLGLNRHDWAEWHTWVGYVMVALVVVHLAMHWRWLVKIAASQKPWRLAVGLLAGVVVAGVFLFAPVTAP